MITITFADGSTASWDVRDDQAADAIYRLTRVFKAPTVRSA